MQVGDIVRMVNPPKDSPHQTWEIKAIKGDFRGLWIRLNDNKDMWYLSRMFVIVRDS